MWIFVRYAAHRKRRPCNPRPVVPCVVIVMLALPLFAGVRVPWRQRTGGPLPLSVQNEVDAAIDRARLGLADRIRGQRPDCLLMASRLALPLTALHHAADPAVIRTRDALLWHWRAVRMDLEIDSDAATVLDWRYAAVWRLDALASVCWPESDFAHQRGPGVREAATAAFCEMLRALSAFFERPVGDPEALEPLFDALDWHHDNLTLSGVDLPVSKGITGDNGQTLFADRVDSVFRQLLVHASDGDALDSASGLARLLQAVRGLPGGGGAESNLAHALTRLWRVQPDRVVGCAMRDFRLSWRMVRVLNTGSLDERLTRGWAADVPDWRLDLARRLLSSQQIDPVHGFGFWRSEDAMDDDTLQATALAILILEAL